MLNSIFFLLFNPMLTSDKILVSSVIVMNVVLGLQETVKLFDFVFSCLQLTPFNSLLCSVHNG